jgi:predicted ATP-dependent endonuclease of OLD family
MSMYPKTLSFENYKRFPAFRLDLSKDILFISGQNGSGKTQLLWACLLFFEAFNKRVESKSTEMVSVTSIDLAILLCCEPLRSLGSLSSFVNKPDISRKSAYVPFVIEFSNDMSTKINVEFNGITSFHYEMEFLPAEKIRFAFQSLGFHFCHWNDEKAQTNILTSASQNMRTLYKDLNPSNRDEITGIMKQLFGIEKIDFTSKYELLVYEKGHSLENLPLEIMFCGSACQKVMSGLILLQTLISRAAPVKFFLIEETEALFYPSLAVGYFRSVRELCATHNIRMILSTNCQEILAVVGNSECKICLSLEFPGEKV